MHVVLQQTFALGRFHANPWRAFPFEDPHGEWPPSPWRLLRAILARSHQLERECGMDCQTWRDSLVRVFCASTVSWSLPSFSWRGPGLRQYQPATFEWDPPGKKEKGKGQNKRYRPTLVRDNFHVVGTPNVVSESSTVWWLLEGAEWSEDHLVLLDANLERMTYFGRAEAITNIRRVEDLPENVKINCVLEQTPSSDSTPVLVPTSDATLDQIQATTDSPSVKSSTVPPGGVWQFAKRPAKPAAKLPPRNLRPMEPTSFVQFAIGTRVSPPRKSTVVLTQHFRGRVIREFLAGGWPQSTPTRREAARLLTGKEADGSPLRDDPHPHVRFGILFDKQTGKATRLLVWRDKPFSDDEQHAILNAAVRELQLSFGKAGQRDPWAVRLVPLDSQVLPPNGFDERRYHWWESVVPYVPPRYVYNRRGRVKSGESVEEQLRLELGRLGFDTNGLTIGVDAQAEEWTRVHRPRRNRNEPTNTERRGYQVSLTFDQPVRGPISLGHSSHFGLGLFVALDD